MTYALFSCAQTHVGTVKEHGCQRVLRHKKLRTTVLVDKKYNNNKNKPSIYPEYRFKKTYITSIFIVGITLPI